MAHLNIVRFLKAPILRKICEWLLLTKAVAQRCSVKKAFFEISQNSWENTCARVSFLTKLRKTLAHELSCEFWIVSKNAFSYRTPAVAASVLRHS